MGKTNYLLGAVRAELLEDPCTKHASIRVGERDGVIILSGSVRSFGEKVAAETAAVRVRGVRGVVHELDIVPTEHQRLADELTAETATKRLLSDSTVPKNAVKVEVEAGAVTLRGRVEHEFQRATAERLVRSLSSVDKVTNLITVGRDAMAGL